MAIRLFVALRPPAAIRARLLDAMGGVPGARWQEDDQLHLTLRFVGAVEPGTGDDLAAALGEVWAPAPVVRLAGPGRFERRGCAHTLWAAVAPTDALAQLHHKVDQACVRAGLPPERRAFHPHVTLARLAASAARAPEIDRWHFDNAGLASAPFALEHLILYESHLGRERAQYEALMRWTLERAIVPQPAGDP